MKFEQRGFVAGLLSGGILIAVSNSPAPAQVTTRYPDPATVKAEREAASNAYGLCLNRAAKRLDDHKSDAATIARGMLSACAAEFDEDVKVHSRYLEDLEGQQKVARALREASLDGAIQLVLSHRKAKSR
jgi:hypothetical protein